MKNAELSQQRWEKVAAGWFNGCNSVRNPWLLPDTQYQWGVNVVCRGGVVQTRPGYRLRLELPPGNLQGGKFFQANKDASTSGPYLVFAVDGKVYYCPFENGQPIQPDNWESYRLRGLSFSPLAKQIHWAIAEKSVEANQETIKIVPTYSVLLIQDGVNACGYWDGSLDGHLNENAPFFQTPRGTWMEYSGGRLWVARGNTLLASDLLDPLSFKERLEGEGRGDYTLPGDITGMGLSYGDNRQTNLLVFTRNQTTGFLSSIIDRSTWADTPNFQFVIYSDLGCIAGKSVVNHAGLLWWYSPKGLVANDSAESLFITSQIKFKDMEMAVSKRNLAPDLTGICAGAFESYLLVSVPSGDTLNAHTQVLDYAVADELSQDSPAAWNGIWTGIRPVEWTKGYVEEEERIWAFSTDYQALPNGTSFNHVWQAFQSDRMDTIDYRDSQNTRHVKKNPIYCSMLSKYLGDGLDLKRFCFAEVYVVEIGDKVTFKASYCGMRGILDEVLRVRLNSLTEPGLTSDSELQNYYDSDGPFRVQTRYLRTQEARKSFTSNCFSVESQNSPDVDSRFAMYFQWCGRAGIDSFRIYLEPMFSEPSSGDCTEDEEGSGALSYRGESRHFNSEPGELEAIGERAETYGSPTSDRTAFVSPISPRVNEVFYSSIPVSWEDLETDCVACLPCARDTFEPPVKEDA